MYSRKILVLTFAALILNLAVPAIAQTYYLDAINGDDSNPGTSGLPWRTLGKAQSVLIDGDKVLLANGDYGQFTTLPYSPYNGDPEESLLDAYVGWITFEAMPGHNPVIDSLSFTQNSGLCYLRYWFRNLKMRAVELKRVVAVNLENCEIVGPGSNIQYAYGGSVSIRNCSNVTVNNCDIHFCEGTSIGISSSAHINISRNDIYDVGSDHLTLRTEYDDCYNIRITDNNIRNTIQWNSSAHPDGIQMYSSSGYRFRECVFARNTMSNMAVQGLFIHADNSGFEDGLIENNLIYNCGSRAIIISKTTGTVFRNNTIIGYSSISETNPGLAVYNNLFCGPYVTKAPYTLGYHDYNIFVRDYTDWTQGSESHSYMYPRWQEGEMASDLFRDPAVGDYSLKNGVLAVNYCPSSPAPSDDKLTGSRDTMPDAGCYEYSDIVIPPVDDPPAEEQPTEEPPAEDPPAQEEPVEEEPSEEQPAEDPPVEEEPAEEQPADEQPAEEEPAEDPVDEQPADEQPAEDPPAQEEPVEEEPSEEQPAEDPPVEEEPAEEQPADEQPAEEEPAEDPVDEQSADEQPAEDPPAQEDPVDEQPTDEQSADEQPAEDPPAQEDLVDEQPTDEQPAEEPPAEDPPIQEEPVEEQPAQDPPVEEQPAQEDPVDEEPAEEQSVEEPPAEEPVGQQPAGGLPYGGQSAPEQLDEEQPVEQQTEEPPVDNEQPAQEQSTEEQPDEETPEEVSADVEQQENNGIRKYVKYNRHTLRKIKFVNRKMSKKKRLYKRWMNRLEDNKQKIQNSKRIRQHEKAKKVASLNNKMSEVRTSYDRTVKRLHKILGKLKYNGRNKRR